MSKILDSMSDTYNFFTDKEFAKEALKTPMTRRKFIEGAAYKTGETGLAILAEGFATISLADVDPSNPANEELITVGSEFVKFGAVLAAGAYALSDVD